MALSRKCEILILPYNFDDALQYVRKLDKSKLYLLFSSTSYFLSDKSPIKINILERLLQSNTILFAKDINGEIYKNSILKKEPITSYTGSYLKELCDGGLTFFNYDKYESIGYTREPELMLIGENYGSGIKFGLRDEFAFYAIKNSPLYLHTALSALENKDSIYFTNAKKTNDEEIDLRLLEEEIKLVRPKRIICLGDIAYAFTKQITSDCIKVPHPQYWKRFKNKQILEYTELFK